MRGPSWSDTAVIITYDENGGFWDHVPPPEVDRWGPATRVPTIVVSPFARGGVDSTVYDTTAVLTLIEKWWNLRPLGDRDASQPDLSQHAMKLSQ
jgi:phospholipase C